MSCMVSFFPTPTSTRWWCRALSLRCAPALQSRATTRWRATNSAALDTTRCGRRCVLYPQSASTHPVRWKGRAVQNSRALALCHYWVAFAPFLPAVLLGAWQMLMRSPLPAPLDDPNAYYTSVTLHVTALAYVVTTFFAMGFGYAVTATSLCRPVRGTTHDMLGIFI